MLKNIKNNQIKTIFLEFKVKMNKALLVITLVSFINLHMNCF